MQKLPSPPSSGEKVADRPDEGAGAWANAEHGVPLRSAYCRKGNVQTSQGWTPLRFPGVLFNCRSGVEFLPAAMI